VLRYEFDGRILKGVARTGNALAVCESPDDISGGKLLKSMLLAEIVCQLIFPRAFSVLYPSFIPSFHVQSG